MNVLLSELFFRLVDHCTTFPPYDVLLGDTFFFQIVYPTTFCDVINNNIEIL